MREVRSEGAETAHTDGQRIERLTHCGKEHAAVHLGEVGTEKKLDAFGRAGQHTRADYDDEEEDEERWHHSLGRTLNALTHATDDDEVGGSKDGYGPQDGT